MALYFVFQEGKGFLDRNLTEWKKPLLMVQDDQSPSEEEDAGPSKSKKPKLSKHTTMKGTAKVCVVACIFLVHFIF